MVEVVHARLTLIKQVVYACVSCKHSLPTTVVLVQAGPVRRSGDFSTPLSTGERSIVTSVSVCVCVFVCVCLSASISSKLHVRSSPNYFCMLPMAVARSSADGVVISYVLPV